VGRPDDYQVRRKHLAHLSDEELKKTFWKTAEKVVNPLLDLARYHTSPSIERSVLLRMGFSSLEARAITDRCMEKGLLGKGAGHVVWVLALEKSLDVREAGLRLARGEDWETVEAVFSAREVNRN